VIGTAHKEILATNKKQAHLRRQEGDDMAHVRSGGLLTALPLVLCLLAAGQPAQAQDKYPSKPVRVLVPYAPGGAVDIIARIVTDHMRQTLGQAFVIENKPGAFGILAIEEMARAKPDGYTLMFGNNNSNVITPVLYAKKITINYEKDVVPVARVADVPGFVIVTTKDFAPRTFAELLAYAKQNPGKVRYGSVGVGSFPHYDMEILSRKAGLDMVHIPNKQGAAGMLNDLVSGDVHVGFLNLATSASMVRAGQLKPLAIVTESRVPEYPDVPTLTELGYPEVGTMQLLAMFAPGGVPREVLDTLHKAAVDAVTSASVREKLKAQSMRPAPTASPDDARAWLQDQIALWRRITNEVKIELPE